MPHPGRAPTIVGRYEPAYPVETGFLACRGGMGVAAARRSGTHRYRMTPRLTA